MAQIKRIARQNATSNFQQGAPDGGGAFRVLADGLDQLYERVKPVAIEQMAGRGADAGQAAAKAQFGNNRPFQQGSSGVSGGGGSNGVTGSAGGDKLHGVDPRINEVLSEASRRTGIKVGVTEGRRTKDRQKSLVAEGKSQTMNSKHLHGGAADYHIIGSDGKANWDFEAYRPLADEAKKIAAERGYDGFEWGGDWETLKDGVHFQFKSGYEEIIASGGGVEAVAGGSGSDDVSAPVTIQKADGSLEQRRYSPYSGEILQAYNAAEKVAYQSEVLNKGAIDLADLSTKFALDPEGFGEAAEEYVDQLVDAAPTDFQRALRSDLGKAVQRRTFGMMDEKQRDISARANNSSMALVDRWSDNLTDAILTGDPDEIAASQSQLDGLLQAREALPGIAWTTEQSANVIIDARKRAAKAEVKRRGLVSKENKKTLNLIIKGAQAGANVAGEDILDDPNVIAEHPELAREAAAFIALRDNMSDFLEMTPSEQAQVVADMASQEVVEEWQLDLTAAADKIATANKKAWADDPVKRASEVMKNDPPPQMPELTPEDPSKIVEGLAERREYMNSLREQGYTDTKAFLSEDESDALKAVMGSDTPPELRAAISAAIVGGFGSDAIGVFDEIGADEVTMYAGKVMALGGNPALAGTMLRGQQILNEGLVRVPPQSDRIDTFSTAAATAFAGIPNSIQAQSEVMSAAQAIYAADPSARSIEPTSDAAKALMGKSIQAALGQSTNKRGQLTGGVQKVMGNDVLLPVGVAGEKVDEALTAALTDGISGGNSFERGINAIAGGLFGSEYTEPSEAWGEGGPPMHNGKPIPPAYIANDNVRMIPAGPNGYRLEIISGSTRIDAQDADGNVFFFDLAEFMEGSE